MENSFHEEQKTTKYDLKTFNGRKLNLNRILKLNLLLLAKTYDRITGRIAEHNRLCISQAKCLIIYFPLLLRLSVSLSKM